MKHLEGSFLGLSRRRQDDAKWNHVLQRHMPDATNARFAATGKASCPGAAPTSSRCLGLSGAHMIRPLVDKSTNQPCNHLPRRLIQGLREGIQFPQYKPLAWKRKCLVASIAQLAQGGQWFPDPFKNGLRIGAQTIPRDIFLHLKPIFHAMLL